MNASRCDAPSLSSWLERRLAEVPPLADGAVRLIGLVVIDPELADPDGGVRTSWIADGDTAMQLLDTHAGELRRFDALAAATWDDGSPRVLCLVESR